MTCSDIQKALDCHFHKAWMKICNSYVLGWESDYLCWVDKSIWCEVEIKVSRADFKRDFSQKPLKHWAISTAIKTGKGTVHSGKEYAHYNASPTKKWSDTLIGRACFIGNQHVPNRFYFACPEGLIDPKELPSHYGLIYILPDGNTRLAKRPKTIHKEWLPLMKDVAIKQSFMIENMKRELEVHKAVIKRLHSEKQNN